MVMDNGQSDHSANASRYGFPFRFLGNLRIYPYLAAISLSNPEAGNGIGKLGVSVSDNPGFYAGVAAAVITSTLSLVAVISSKKLDTKGAAQIALNAAEITARDQLLTQYRNFVIELRDQIEKQNTRISLLEDRSHKSEHKHRLCEGRLSEMKMSIWFLRQRLGLSIDPEYDPETFKFKDDDEKE